MMRHELYSHVREGSVLILYGSVQDNHSIDMYMNCALKYYEITIISKALIYYINSKKYKTDLEFRVDDCTFLKIIDCNEGLNRIL